jgi:hypothetical protein
MRRRPFSRFEMSSAVHRLDTRTVHTCAMAQHDDSDRQAWLIDYNEERPHSSLGYLTPKEFVERLPANPTPQLSAA